MEGSANQSEDCGNHIDTILRGVAKLTREQLDMEIVVTNQRLDVLQSLRRGMDGPVRRKRKTAAGPEAPAKKRGRPKKVDPLFPDPPDAEETDR